MPIIKPLFLGILAAFFSLVAELTFSVFFQGSAQAYFFSQLSLMVVAAVVIEEVLKYVIVYKNASLLKGTKEILASSILIGAGFALTEISLDVYGQLNILKTSFFFLIGVLFVHVFTTTFSGYLLAKKQNIYFTTVRVLIVNILIHLFYNIAIIYLF